MPITLVQADAFTERPYRGNPAAVCVLSRYFAPALGVDEDPVTGSAHWTPSAAAEG